MTQTALITGGARGIGAETVRKFIKEGFKVAYLYEKNHEAAKALTMETGAIAIQCDISKHDEVSRACNEAKDALNVEECFDVVVCNAGISHIGIFDMMGAEKWNHLMNVNLNGNVEVVRRLIPDMISWKKGSIVMVSSMWGQVGASCEVAYSTSKAAIIGFTKSLAKEVGLSGIRVNCVCPGVIDTDMNKDLEPDVIDDLKDGIPLGRVGSAKEVAKGIFFLASEDASYITGQILGINGGIVC